MMSWTSTKRLTRVRRWHLRWTYKGPRRTVEDLALDGAPRTLEHIKVIYTEMSLCPLYDREVPFFDLYSRILKLGFRCVGISPGFLDPTTWEVLQVDATFVTEREPAARPAKIA